MSLPGSKAAAGRLQSAVSYAFLLTLLLIVVFPFYWMTIKSSVSSTAYDSAACRRAVAA